MGDVLDLKDAVPGEAPRALEQAELERTTREPQQDVSEMQGIEELAENALARASLATTAAWTAHHPIEGEARKRHMLVSAALVGFAALISVWQWNPAAFVVVLFGVAALELRRYFSKPVSVVVNEVGLEVDGQQYDHASFASFHIHRMPDDTLELSLKSGRRLIPHIRLPLGQQDPYELHAILTQYIPEGQHRIPLTDYFVRKPRS